MAQHRRLIAPRLARNPHLEQLAGYFGGIAPQAADIPDTLEFILLCFTNRSGSSYLAELLASDGLLPLAGENLNAETVIEHSKKHDFRSFQAYFAYLCQTTRRAGRVAIKITPAHLEILSRSGILDQIAGRSHFIVIERGDRLGQAISHLIAVQSGRFSASAEAGAAAEYDRNMLDLIMSYSINAYRDFAFFFGLNGIVPAHVLYEQLARDPEGCIAGLGQMLGIENLAINPANIRQSRQSGPLNARFRARYLSESS